ncbi:MAG: zinc ABC transporter substrate-binding protein [Desulfurivibrionaceae bacterium]
MSRQAAQLSFILLLTLVWATDVLAARKPLVFVTIIPQAFLVERIGGDAVEVHTVAAKGQDPHTFEATPRQAAALGQAQLFFTVGMPFEKRLVAKLPVGTNRKLKVVDSSAGITRLMMKEHHHGDHHVAAHASAGGEPDPHVWLAPANLLIMANNMATAMIGAAPEHKALFLANLAALDVELKDLDKRLSSSLAPHSGKTFYVFHPAFGYFAAAYGLTQEAVETGGKSPSPKQMQSLIREAREEGVKVIFVQPQFDVKSAATVAKGIGGTVIPIDPMAKDVPANLAAVAAAIERALRQQPAAGRTGGK